MLATYKHADDFGAGLSCLKLLGTSTNLLVKNLMITWGLLPCYLMSYWKARTILCDRAVGQRWWTPKLGSIWMFIPPKYINGSGTSPIIQIITNISHDFGIVPGKKSTMQETTYASSTTKLQCVLRISGCSSVDGTGSLHFWCQVQRIVRSCRGITFITWPAKQWFPEFRFIYEYIYIYITQGKYRIIMQSMYALCCNIPYHTIPYYTILYWKIIKHNVWYNTK